MADSMKKSQRSDLRDISSDETIVSTLYVDPFESDFVFESSKKANNTVLLGRKGTGKSTILARLKEEIRSEKDKLFVYLDVKNIYDKVLQTHQYNISEEAVSNEVQKKYLLYKQFTLEFMDVLFKEIENSIKYKSWFSECPDDLIRRISIVFEEIKEAAKNDINLISDVQITESEKNTDSLGGSAGFTMSATPGFSLGINGEQTDEKITSTSYQAKLLNVFPFIQTMEKVRDILLENQFQYVYLAFDDFSELNFETMKLFVDIIVTPLNNSMFDFFKVKISAYPYRYYMGNIDPTKIDLIKLDYYAIYTNDRIDKIEQSATNYVRRLIENRAKYFLKDSIEDYFDLSEQTMNEYYKELFYASSAIPRNVGWVLWYLYRSTISQNRKIKVNDIKQAAESYFSEVIELYLSKDFLMNTSFDEKLKRHEFRSVLEVLKKNARDNKNYIKSSKAKIFSGYGNNPPTSHFYVSHEIENILYSLELNFFISRVNEQKDQDSDDRRIFYSLNYGFCSKNDIGFGKGNDRKYRIQRRFNYTESLNDFINNIQEIECDSCPETFTMDFYEKISFFDMLCPACKKGTCQIVKKYTLNEQAVDCYKPLPIEFNLMNSLRIVGPQYAKELSEELDISYQKVSRIVDALENEGLVIRKNNGSRVYYENTQKVNKIYF